jgi:hypothetical protein
MDTDWDHSLKYYEDSPRNESKYDVILVYKAGDSNIYMNYRRKFQFLMPCLFPGIHFPGNHFPNFPVFVCH